MLFINAHLIDSSLDCNGAILVENGLISRVLPVESSSSEIERLKLFLPHESVIDVHGLTIMPSFIDMHTHSRYPGQSQKEELETFLNACASGGFGTVVCMANTNPVVSSLEQVLSVEWAASQFHIADVIQAVSITRDFNGKDVSHLDGFFDTENSSSLLSKSLGHAVFVSEDGRDVPSASVMLAAMKRCAMQDAIVSCHCEDNSIAEIVKPIRLTAAAEADNLLALAEDCATMRNLEIALFANCRIHIAHVSTKKSMDAIRNAKKINCCADKEPLAAKNGSENFSNIKSFDNSKVTCEVTPHHIALSSDNYEKVCHIVNPPLRPETDRLSLIDAIIDGTVDVIATDHAPHTADDKANGAPGFSGLETAFAVCNTVLVNSGKINLSRLSELMSDNPAKILGFQPVKKKSADLLKTKIWRGQLKAGFAADLVVVDPTLEWNVDSSCFASKGKYTPFQGNVLCGKVLQTYFRGKKVF